MVNTAMTIDHDQQAPPAAPLIAMRDLYKGYNNSGARIEILKGVNFEIDSGETLAVIGASGIGKSTCTSWVRLTDPTKAASSFEGRMFSDMMTPGWLVFEIKWSALFFSSITFCLSSALWKMR